MKTKITLLLFIFTLGSSISAFAQGDHSFKQSGLSFQYPADWEISEQESFDGQGYYLAVEKKGFDSSGLISMTFLEGEIDLDEFIQANIQELKNNAVYGNAKFESIKDGKYNNIDARTTSYKFSLLGIKHRGSIYAFYGKNRTYVFLKQEALEDIDKNEAGFNLLERSFSTN